MSHTNPKTITLQRLNTFSSKFEEVHTLRRLVDFFAGTQTYMSSLFTPALVERFEEQVRSDFSLDIVSELDKCEEMLAERNREIAELQRAQEKAQREHASEIARMEREFTQAQREFDKAIRTLNSDLAFARELSNEEIARLRENMLAFKERAFAAERERTALELELERKEKELTIAKTYIADHILSQ